MKHRCRNGEIGLLKFIKATGLDSFTCKMFADRESIYNRLIMSLLIIVHYFPSFPGLDHIRLKMTDKFKERSDISVYDVTMTSGTRLLRDSRMF